jgi:RNA-binding protein 15
MDSDYGRSRDMYRRNSYEEKVLPPPLPPQRDNIVNRISHLLPEEDGFATRTLFVGNVDPDITAEELRAVFDRYGYVEDVDIKKPGAGGGNPYAFIRYFNLNMAHAAKVKLSGKFIGPYQCKIGYGKPSPTSCVWVGNLGPWISKHGLGREFDRFGTVQRVVWPEGHDFAYITYNNVESAKEAVSRMRGHRLKGAEKLLRTDFVDLKHPESDLNFKTFDRRSRSLSLSPGRRSHSRHISRSRSFSRSVSGSRSPASSTASMKAKRKKHKIKEKESQSTKRSRMSAGPSQVRSDKKRKRRSASVSSNASSHSDESNPDGRHAPMSRNAPQAKNGATELKTVTDMSRCLPMVWNGVLSLKNSAFVVDMHLVTGSPSLVSMLMCNSKLVKFSNLKLTQRLRMEPSKLDEVRRRIHLSSGDWCVMLAVTSPTNTEILEPGMQERPIKNLVSYLRQKEAAGVLSLPPNSPHGQETGLLHTFAPSEFAHEYLKQRAPKLDLNLEAEDYIVVILVRVNV